MAERLGKAAKVGNIDNCFVPNDENKNLILLYCENNFVSDYNRFKDCKSLEDFCYICCENEFGDLHIQERDKCYNKCDKSSMNI